MLQCFAFQARLEATAPEVRSRVIAVTFCGVNHAIVLVTERHRVYFWDTSSGLCPVMVSFKAFATEEARHAAQDALEVAVYDYVRTHGRLPEVRHAKPDIGQETEFIRQLAAHVADAAPVVYRALMEDGTELYALAAANTEFIGIYSPQYGARLFPRRPNQSLDIPAFERAAVALALKGAVAQLSRVAPAALGWVGSSGFSRCLFPEPPKRGTPNAIRPARIASSITSNRPCSL